MLLFEEEWRKLPDREAQEKEGMWIKADFYGPFCSFIVRNDGVNITVKPISVSYESSEVAIGDYNVLRLMTKEIFEEFGKFYLYIPKFKRKCLIDSTNTEKPLLKLLKDLPLIVE